MKPERDDQDEVYGARAARAEAPPATPMTQETASLPGSSPTDNVNATKKPSRLGRYKGFVSVMQLLAGALLLAFLINHFLFQSYQVFGQSMVPTLNEGDRLIISKIGKSWSSLTGGEYIPDRGEIIVFESTLSSGTQLVKRVVGLPGERVVVTDGEIRIFNVENPDGFDPDVEYKEDLETTVGSIDVVVPEGEVFVIGDNRRAGGSLDSRNELGTVPLENIVGKLVLRLFPLSDAKVF